MTASKAKKAGIIAVAAFLLLILLVFAILNNKILEERLNELLTIFRPILIGLVLAYLANPIFCFFERKLFLHLRPTALRRTLALLCTYIVLVLILAALIMLIVPQLIITISDFIKNDAKEYFFMVIEKVNQLVTLCNDQFDTGIPLNNAEWLWEQLKAAIRNANDDQELQNMLMNLLNSNNIASLFQMWRGIYSIFTDTVFGIFISIYVLASKERQYAQIKRITHALLPSSAEERLYNICAVADRSFGGFLRGKILDSSIVGVLVFVLVSLLARLLSSDRLDTGYIMLISVVIAITDIIPVVGPFIGVIPTAVIILLIDPVMVIPFLLCILLVQQIDGNIIAPKILGENTGVSSLCVMIVITLLGAFWGAVGMIIAVPLAATILEVLNRYLEKRLEKKGLPVDTEHYYGQKAEARAVKSKSDAHKKKKKRATSEALPSPVCGRGSFTEAERWALRAATAAPDDCPTDIASENADQ